MNIHGMTGRPLSGNVKGFCHMAISVGSKENVDKLTEKMRCGEVEVISRPRMTGDGKYESVIADPEGNLIELTV